MKLQTQDSLHMKSDFPQGINSTADCAQKVEKAVRKLSQVTSRQAISSVPCLFCPLAPQPSSCLNSGKWVTDQQSWFVWDWRISCVKSCLANSLTPVIRPFYTSASPALSHCIHSHSRVWQVLQSSSVQFSRSVVSDSLRPHESQHAKPPCPSPTPGVYPNSRPSSWWCHPAISSSVISSSCPQSLPAPGSFPISSAQIWDFPGKSTGVGCH